MNDGDKRTGAPLDVGADRETGEESGQGARGDQRLGQPCPDCGERALACPSCASLLHFDEPKARRDLAAIAALAALGEAEADGGAIFCCPVCSQPCLLSRHMGLLLHATRSMVLRRYGAAAVSHVMAQVGIGEGAALLELGIPVEVLEALDTETLHALHDVAVDRRRKRGPSHELYDFLITRIPTSRDPGELPN